MSRVRWPAFDNCVAAASPAGPPPRMMTSCSMRCLLMSWVGSCLGRLLRLLLRRTTRLTCDRRPVRDGQGLRCAQDRDEVLDDLAFVADAQCDANLVERF